MWRDQNTERCPGLPNIVNHLNKICLIILKGGGGQGAVPQTLLLIFSFKKLKGTKKIQRVPLTWWREIIFEIICDIHSSTLKKNSKSSNHKIHLSSGISKMWSAFSVFSKLLKIKFYLDAVAEKFRFIE